MNKREFIEFCEPMIIDSINETSIEALAKSLACDKQTAKLIRKAMESGARHAIDAMNYTLDILEEKESK